MMFQDKYTTAVLIAADTKEIEAKKIVVSDDSYAKCFLMQEILNKMEHMRLSR